MDNNLSAVGPGAELREESDVRPLLEGAGRHEYVIVFNPLSRPFTGVYGVDRPTHAQIRVSFEHGRGVTRTEDDIRQNYGLSLNNPDHQTKASITNTVTIDSGKTIRLLGGEAQVIVRQLVTYILQQEGQTIKLWDAYARNQVEKRVIVGRGLVNELLGHDVVSVNDQLQQAIKEPVHEEEFPALRQSGNVGDGPGAGSGTANPAPARRGRPKAAPNAT